ncbi:MAG: RNA-binding domain-containing protein [Candidatus Thorarchaeota archaeon]
MPRDVIEASRTIRGSKMLFIERIEARAYSRATEVPSRVHASLLAILPEELRPEATVTTKRAEGQYQNVILVLTMVLKGREDCKRTFSYLMQALQQEDVDRILETLKERVDEVCRLYLRIEKQHAYMGQIRLAHGPDVISVSVHFRNFPRCSVSDIREFILDSRQRREWVGTSRP